MRQRILLSALTAALAVAVPARRAPAEHYAILFCGGVDVDQNWLRYYNTTNWMYTVLTERFNYLPQNVYVLAADGLDPADDRQIGNWAGFGATNSDWTAIVANGSTVDSATRGHLQSTIASMGMTERDTFFFWGFDHGSGDTDPNETDEEELCGWGVNIGALQFRDDVAAVPAGRQAYAFMQCFAGGMLDELDMTGGDARWGCAAANHYEPSLWDPLAIPCGFAEAFYDGMDAGYTSTHDIFDYAFDNAPHVEAGGPEGEPGALVQHPWMTGDDFDLVVADWSGADDGAWNNTLNWSYGELPEPTRTVRLRDTRPAILDGYNDSIWSLLMQADTALHVTGGSRLDVAADVETAGTSQIVIAVGSEMSARDLLNYGEVSVGGLLEVADSVVNQGEIHIHDSGDLNVAWDLANMPGATVHVEDYGSSLNVMYDLTANGTIEVSNYADLNVWNMLYAGVNHTSTINLTDAELYVDNQMLLGINESARLVSRRSDIAVASLLSVGETDQAEMSLLGGTLTAEYLFLGHQSGSSGKLTIDVDGIFHPWIGLNGANRKMVVGSQGYGEVAQNAGELTRADMDGNYPDLILADDNEAVGVYTLHDGKVHVQNLRVGVDGEATFTQNGGQVTVEQWLFFGGSSTRDCLYELNGGTLKAHQVIQTPSSHGQININGGTLDLTGPSIDIYRLYIAYAPGSTGLLELTGKTLDVETFYVGMGGAIGSGTFNMNGGTTTVGTELSVGHTGPGALKQTGGAVTAPAVYVGRGTDHVGQYTLDGGSLTVAGALTLGTYGHGTFTLETGDLATDETIVGHQGTGTFTQHGGRHVIATDLYVGMSGSASSYTLDDPTAKLEADREYIGYDAAGAFIHNDGTNEVAGDLVLGYGAAAHGVYTLYKGVLAVGGDIHVGSGGGTGRLALAGGKIGGVSGTLMVPAGTSELTGCGIIAKAVENHGTLTATGGPLALEGGYSGDGNVAIMAGATLDLRADAVVAGPVVNDGLLRVSKGTTQLLGAVATSLGGNIVADLGAKLELSADASAGDLVSTGSTRQLAGTAALTGMLKVGGDYSLESPGAVLSSPLARIEGTFDLVEGLHEANTMYVGGTLSTAACSVATATLRAATLHVGMDFYGADAPGELRLLDANAQVEVSDSLHIHPKGAISAVPGAAIHMTGSAFVNECTDASAAGGLNNLTLIFEGGLAATDPFEVAGADFGDSPMGLRLNFALDRLQIGGDDIGQVRLVDLVGNQPGPPALEALYVKELVVGAGSALDLNGLKLYFLEGVIDPAATITGGSPVRIPEPAAMALVAMGLGAVALRRRRRPAR